MVMFRLFISIVIIAATTLTLPARAGDIEELFQQEKMLSSIKDPLERAIYLYHLSDAFFEVDEKKYQKYLDEGFRLARSIDSPRGIGFYHGFLSMRAFNREAYQEAIQHATLASGKLLEGGDTLSYINSEYIRVVSYYNMDFPYEAELIIREVIALAGEWRFPVEKGKLILYLAHIHRDRRDPDTPELYRNASRLFTEGNDPKWTFALYRGLASFYAGTSQPDSAVHYGRKTINLIRNLEPFNKLSFISTAYWLSGILLTEEYYDEAIALLKEAGIRSVDLTMEGLMLSKKAKQVNYLFFQRQKARFHTHLALLGLTTMLLFGLITLIYYQRIRKKKMELDHINHQLALSLEQNKILLKETQHRVKNNYQMIMSMLSIHQYKNGQSVLDFVSQSNSRIGAMARVHELLYQQQELSQLSLSVYLNDIINTTLHSLASHPGAIKVQIETSQLTFDLNTTLLLGLIVNELLINSLKHVFAQFSRGSISIEIVQHTDHYMLYYADSGPGIDPQQLAKETVGLNLIRSLAKQLNGFAEFSAGTNKHCSVMFQPY